MERSQGILRRLAATPLGAGSIVAGKAAARRSLGLFQATFAMIVGRWLFGVRWGENRAAVVGFLVVYAALTAMLGMLGRSERQVVGLGVISWNVLAAVGGCWWRLEITPLWAQRPAWLTPTGWAMDALHRLVSFGQPPGAILRHFALSATAAFAAAWAAVRLFRFD